ncbi:hypothetical protein V491_07705 [Pseudogymnoascus sp. VKM F-3775]|nr:hypothetical protein V491_07705 [Pseudogymnoascus sp. VKM F-3775]
MSNRTSDQVTYDSVDSYKENSRKVAEIIKKGTDRPIIETRSLPPILFPMDLTELAIDELKALSGVKVKDVSNKED